MSRAAGPAAGRVVVAGSVNVDLFARVPRHPGPGETLLGSDGSTRPGGKGANQAVAAALAGAATVMVGCVGDDAPAATGLSLLRRAGADVTRVRTVPGTPTGLALITVADSGENSIVVIPGANAEVSPADVAGAGITAGDVVVVQGEIPLPAIEETAAVCARAGARLIVNLAPVVPLSPGVLRQADPLVVNEHEARAAAAILTAPDAASAASASAGAAGSDELTPGEAAALARSLREHGVASVVITLGGAGAVTAAGGQVHHCPGEQAQVVDTTGAGDCFTGTLAAALAAGHGLLDAAARGNAAASRSVRGHGAQESYDWTERP